MSGLPKKLGNPRNPSDEELERYAEWLFSNKNTCAGCGDHCAEEDRFCPHCGKRNPNFDEKEFLRGYGTTMKEITKKECLEGHPGFCDVEEENRLKFCPLCGRPITLN